MVEVAVVVDAEMLRSVERVREKEESMQRVEGARQSTLVGRTEKARG